MRTALSLSFKLPLRARLAIVMACSALALTGFGIWSLNQLSDTSTQLLQLANANQKATGETAKLKETLAERHALLAKLRQAFSEGSEDSRLLLQTKIHGLNVLITDQSKALLERTTQGLSTDAQDQFRYHTALYLSYQTQLMDSLAKGNLSYADRNLSQMLTPSYLQIEQQLGKVAQLQQAQQLATIASIAQDGQTQRTVGILLLVLAGLLIISMPVVLFWGVIRRLRIIQPILERLQRGELSEVALPEGSDEVGKIAQGINTVSHNLAQAASFAHAVGQNRFDTPFEAAGENDLLGSALVDMRDRLRDVAEDEARRSWAIKGMAQFGEILRAHQDLDTFADQIISNLTRYIDGVQGAFFILQDEQQGKQRLKLMGCYAYDRKKYIDATFDLGEGLAGQAALERSTIYITEVPQNYVAITSGLGQANPQAILVVPLISNDTLFGVLEFAAFRHFPAHVIEFVEKLAENIASTLTHVKNNARTMVLLEETQRMTEALRTNEEELRQNMEELHATHEEMKRVQLEMQGQVSAMNNAALVSEADLKGDIIYCNDTFCLVAKYGREELMGRNHRMLKSGHQPQELFENLWATVSRGQVWKGEVKNRAKDGTYYWVAATITPVLGTDSKPLKYIGVRFDITLQKEQEAMISQQLEEAQAQEEELRQNSEEMAAQQEEMVRVQLELEGQLTAINRSNAVIEFDTHGNILAANANFLKVMGYSLEEIQGRHHSIFMNAVDAKSDDYAQHWSRLAKGEFLAGEFRRRAKNGDEIWIMGSYNPIFNKDGVVYKVIKFASDITLAKQQEAQIRQTLEEVQAQEEELRQNSEEMAAQQEEMVRIQMELEGQLTAINRSNAVIEFDTHGNILNVNANFLKVMGYNQEEIQGRHHSIFMDAVDAKSDDYAQHWSRLAKGEFFAGEFRRRAKNGDEIWILGSYNPIFNRDGVVYKVIKFASDITLAKQQEAQVRQTLEEVQAQEEELRQNSEEMAAQQEEMARVQLELKGQVGALNSAALVSEADVIGNIIYCNDTFCQVAKYTREELLGNNHRMLKSGHQPQALFEDMWATISQGKVWRGEVKNRAKDGSYYWVAATISPVVGNDGKPLKYIGVRFDITAQKTQEEQVRQVLEETQAQEEELRQNAEEVAAQQEEMARLSAELEGQLKAINRSTAVVEFDTKGNIIQANERFLSVMGYKLEEIQGRHHRLFVDNSVAVSDAYRAFWEKLQQGEFVTGEFRRIAKDGSTRWIQGSYNPVFNSEGVLYKVVKFAADTTEAKMQDLAIEEELNRARQAEAQLRAELQSLHKQALIEICANGEIGAVSADLLKLAGYEAQELTGQPLSTLTGGDAQSANALYTQLASQQSAQQNFSIITKSGQKLLLHGYFSKVQDKAQEKMIGMLHID